MISDGINACKAAPLVINKWLEETMFGEVIKYKRNRTERKRWSPFWRWKVSSCRFHRRRKLFLLEWSIRIEEECWSSNSICSPTIFVQKPIENRVWRKESTDIAENRWIQRVWLALPRRVLLLVSSFRLSFFQVNQRKFDHPKSLNRVNVLIISPLSFIERRRKGQRHGDDDDDAILIWSSRLNETKGDENHFLFHIDLTNSLMQGNFSAATEDLLRRERKSLLCSDCGGISVDKVQQMLANLEQSDRSVRSVPSATRTTMTKAKRRNVRSAKVTSRSTRNSAKKLRPNPKSNNHRRKRRTTKGNSKKSGSKKKKVLQWENSSNFNEETKCFLRSFPLIRRCFPRRSRSPDVSTRFLFHFSFIKKWVSQLLIIVDVLLKSPRSNHRETVRHASLHFQFYSRNEIFEEKKEMTLDNSCLIESNEEKSGALSAKKAMMSSEIYLISSTVIPWNFTRLRLRNAGQRSPCLRGRLTVIILRQRCNGSRGKITRWNRWVEIIHRCWWRYCRIETGVHRRPQRLRRWTNFARRLLGLGRNVLCRFLVMNEVNDQVDEADDETDSRNADLNRLK